MKKKRIVIIILVVLILLCGLVRYQKIEYMANSIVYTSLIRIGVQLEETTNALNANEDDEEYCETIIRWLGNYGFDQVHHNNIVSWECIGYKKYELNYMEGWFFQLQNVNKPKEAAIANKQIASVNQEFADVSDALLNHNGATYKNGATYNFHSDLRHLKEKLQSINALCQKYMEELE